MQINLKFGENKGIVDTHGGELVSFQDTTGKEYIWCGDPAFWSGRNPNLFPIVGSLKDGKTVIDGNVYEMGRHGFARLSDYAVIDRGEDYVVFELTENEETLKCYPFKFSFQVIHRLQENGFATEFKVTNTGDVTLPYCVGAHTAFNCPMNEGEKFDEYQLVFDKEEEASTLLLTSAGLFDGGKTDSTFYGKVLPLNHEDYARLDTIVLGNLNSNGVSLVHKETGHGVHMEFEQFPMIAFWTKGAEKAPYICLEPWHGCAGYTNETGNMVDKPHVICLEPGETKSLTYTVTMI